MSIWWSFTSRNEEVTRIFVAQKGKQTTSTMLPKGFQRSTRRCSCLGMRKTQSTKKKWSRGSRSFLVQSHVAQICYFLAKTNDQAEHEMVFSSGAASWCSSFKCPKSSLRSWKTFCASKKCCSCHRPSVWSAGTAIVQCSALCCNAWRCLAVTRPPFANGGRCMRPAKNWRNQLLTWMDVWSAWFPFNTHVAGSIWI